MTDNEIALDWYNRLADNKKKRIVATYGERENREWLLLNSKEILRLYTKIHKIRDLFLICDHGKEFFTDCDDFASTYQIAITHIDYNIDTKVMTITCRRPGVLIGKAGRHIKELQERLECKIEIIESILEII